VFYLRLYTLKNYFFLLLLNHNWMWIEIVLDLFLSCRFRNIVSEYLEKALDIFVP